MTKDEYVKTLEKHMAKVADSKYDDYYAGCFDGLKKAIDLAEKLDEPKKVVIPQFVANWIEEAKIYSDNEVDSLKIIFWIGDYISDTDSHYEWLGNIDNQELLLNAIANGYEIEKQKKYRVKIDSKLYFQRFENIEAVFVIDDSLGVKESSPVFTREVGNKILETLGVESGQLEEAEDE
ncbi:DUF1642 domain-containing protein [Pediococcus pentosaceus]|uniref:DUF1642 domain-containing protein n=1 Tax=Pediococcus pentosaceus TaxID=1255 RepID=UPI0013300B0F|nr:DUF1642 domain-containing protein [Pediococcus pentosaceus]KAF0422867.1 DUF1642 domain-containing protein [Pediococcus pentosaceus]